MNTSFFRALDPTSTRSGIKYCLADGLPCQNQEMLDLSPLEYAHLALTVTSNWFNITFLTLYGDHYDFYLRGAQDCQGGAKGILDFLIFPLVARKLIADCFLDENQDKLFANFFAWMIAVPLEAVRFGAAAALTLIMAPIVILIDWLKNAFTVGQENMLVSTHINTV